MQDDKYGSNLIILCIDIQFFQEHLLKMMSLEYAFDLSVKYQMAVV